MIEGMVMRSMGPQNAVQSDLIVPHAGWYEPNGVPAYGTAAS